MCGIGGFAGVGDRLTLDERLAAVTAAMEHRGPDDAGSYVAEHGGGLTGLCACRLAIQDISANGHQPMTSRRTGNAVALNGELYNVDELRDDLRSRGHEFRGHSDTEVA